MGAGAAPDGRTSNLAAVGLVLLPALCCGLPTLIAAGGLGLVGSVLRSPWLIGIAVLALLGLLSWWLTGGARRRPGACCPPEAPAPPARQDRPERG